MIAAFFALFLAVLLGKPWQVASQLLMTDTYNVLPFSYGTQYLPLPDNPLNCNMFDCMSAYADACASYNAVPVHAANLIAEYYTLPNKGLAISNGATYAALSGQVVSICNVTFSDPNGDFQCINAGSVEIPLVDITPLCQVAYPASYTVSGQGNGIIIGEYDVNVLIPANSTTSSTTQLLNIYRPANAVPIGNSTEIWSTCAGLNAVPLNASQNVLNNPNVQGALALYAGNSFVMLLDDSNPNNTLYYNPVTFQMTSLNASESGVSLIGVCTDAQTVGTSVPHAFPANPGNVYNPTSPPFVIFESAVQGEGVFLFSWANATLASSTPGGSTNNCTNTCSGYNATFFNPSSFPSNYTFADLAAFSGVAASQVPGAPAGYYVNTNDGVGAIFGANSASTTSIGCLCQVPNLIATPASNTTTTTTSSIVTSLVSSSLLTPLTTFTFSTISVSLVTFTLSTSSVPLMTSGMLTTTTSSSSSSLVYSTTTVATALSTMTWDPALHWWPRDHAADSYSGDSGDEALQHAFGEIHNVINGPIGNNVPISEIENYIDGILSDSDSKVQSLEDELEGLEGAFGQGLMDESTYYARRGELASQLERRVHRDFRRKRRHHRAAASSPAAPRNNRRGRIQGYSGQNSASKPIMWPLVPEKAVIPQRTRAARGETKHRKTQGSPDAVQKGPAAADPPTDTLSSQAGLSDPTSSGESNSNSGSSSPGTFTFKFYSPESSGGNSAAYAPVSSDAGSNFGTNSFLDSSNFNSADQSSNYGNNIFYVAPASSSSSPTGKPKQDDPKVTSNSAMNILDIGVQMMVGALAMLYVVHFL